MPDRIARLPRARGYPVPFFVAWVDGVADFRVIDAAKWVRAVKERRCWLCGEPLGAYLAFVIGPMCAVNRVSSEPPSHRECAEYAVRVCPFLTQPAFARREAHLPAGYQEPAGIGLKRNPGVALLWVTKSFEQMRVATSREPKGVLFQVGPPVALTWWTEGREATRDEILASIDGGLPALREMATAEGPHAVRELESAVSVALQLVPA
jgi:hypothetical protein